MSARSIKNENKKSYPINRLTLFLVIIIIVIAGTSIIGYAILQTSSEQDVRSSVFHQYQERQKVYASSLAHNIESDLNMLVSKLETVALSKQVQDGDSTGSHVTALLDEIFADANAISQIDGVYIIDKEDKIVNYVNPSIEREAVFGFDTSELPPVIEYRNNLPNPTFSNAYVPSENGTLRIALLYPIYDSQTAEHTGAVAMVLVLDSFFSHYGNIQDITAQYLAALDGRGTVLASAASDIVGRDVFSDYVYNLHEDKSAYDHYRKVMDGSPSVATFGFKTGSRLNIGEPIILDGRPVYSLFVVTPTAAIYSEVDRVLASQRIEALLFLSIIAAAISILILFLVRWNRTLDEAVRRRTRELEDANERLEMNDKMQREFINIAAHELRTPIQPLLGMTELIQHSLHGNDRTEITKEDVQLLARNAKRLERLSYEILEVSRIESQSLTLNKEAIDLNEKIQNVIKDIKSFLPADRKIDIIFDSISSSTGEPVVVEIDRVRIFEVLSNILRNAIKFTQQGTIRIRLGKDAEGKMAIVQISDTGTGIDPEIYPKLFTKFATKSEQGTGLGLYISKSIVEAHGGRIWAENNAEGGATFVFTLPIRNS